MTIDYSIVIPARNEELRLPTGLRRLLSILERDRTEIVFVDDGSNDRTFDVASNLLSDLPHVTLVRFDNNRGKGAAVREGVLRASGSVVAFVDADMATDPKLLRELFSALETHDIAVGSRSLAESNVHSHSIRRAFLGRALNRLVRQSTGIRVSDTQCGFKAFRAPVARLLFAASRVEGFAFDIEVLNLSYRLGLSVAEIPVDWTDLPGGTVSLLREPFRIVKDMIRFRSSWNDAAPVHAVTISTVAATFDNGACEAVCDALGLDSALVLLQLTGVAILLPASTPEQRFELRDRAEAAYPHSGVTLDEVPVSSLIARSRALVSLPPRRFRS